MVSVGTRKARAKASWAASSARSKSPRKPIRVARTRPHSSWKTRSIRALHLHHGANLDGAARSRRRDPRREGHRLVEVVGLDQVVAAELLLGLDKRPVGGQGLA